MTFSDILFYLFAALLIVAAVRVVLARSPVVAVLHLILCFFTASCLWFLIGAEFLALLLIVVYVGAVMVLFLFVVMMINVKGEAHRHDFRKYLPLGGLLALVMLIELGFVLYTATKGVNGLPPMSEDYNNVLYLGTDLYQKYSYGIQVGGLILLVGMVSAIALTMRPRKNAKWTIVSEQLVVNPKDRLTVVKMEAEKDEPAEQPAEEAPADKPANDKAQDQGGKA